MTLFIKDIVAFLLIPVVFILVFFLLYKSKVNNLKFDNGVSLIICGDSHTQSAINDSLLAGSVNISMPSQHYAYTYNVLRHLLNNSSKIKTILLGCSFHSFGKKYDMTLFDNEEASVMYALYFPLLDVESLSKIASENMLGVLKSGTKISKTMVISVLKNYNSIQDFRFIGNYYKSNNSNISDTIVKAAIARHYLANEMLDQPFSITQELYLRKIADLCKSKDIKLILVNPPIWKGYYKKIPKKFILNYYSVVSSLNNQVTFWDFHALSLNAHCFGDGDHLNSKGSQVFTTKIDSLVHVDK